VALWVPRSEVDGEASAIPVADDEGPWAPPKSDSAERTEVQLQGVSVVQDHDVTAALHRFWIELESSVDGPSRLAYGVTAFDEADALAILRHFAYEDRADEMPAVAKIVADVNVEDLDPGHVRPNMNPPNWRGIWFPKGLDRDIH
jgi:hypothetical protein